MTRPKLSVVTVWYMSTQAVGETAHSWQEAFNECKESLELLVAENSENRVTNFDLFSKPFRNHVNVKLSDHPVNLGFARAANLLAKQSQGDWLLFLNPDVFLARGAITELLGSLEKLVINSQRVAAISLEVNGTVLSGIKINAAGLFVDRKKGSSSKLLGPSGGALLIERDTFLRFGGFQEALFMWGEDFDFSLTLKAHGVDTAELDFRWRHLGGHSLRDSVSRRQKAYLIARNRLWILRSRFEIDYLIRFFPIVFLSMVANLILRKLPRGLFFPYLRGLIHGLFAQIPSELYLPPKLSIKQVR